MIWAMHYNILLVLFSTLTLGLAAGAIGAFLVLRKQALISDAVTHATLPGIAIGFLIALYLGIDNGKSLPILLICSFITASCGAFSAEFITNKTRLSPDTAIAVVMSFFYGAGLLLFSLIQNIPEGNKAGLNTFLLGQISGLQFNDFIIIGCTSLTVITLVFICFRALRLLCFDPDYAALSGFNAKSLQRLMLALMIIVVCIGLKTVGLILIIALLIIPAITARLWSDRTIIMVTLSSLLGATSCVVGVLISIRAENMPTGSTIILVAFSLLMISIVIKQIRGLNA